MVFGLLLWLVPLTLMAAACGGGSESPPLPAAGVFRLSQGFDGIYEGINVGVMQVATKAKPEGTALSD